MLTSKAHLENAISSGDPSSKKGVEAFYQYIRSELVHKYPSITRYSNPLKMTFCIYFALLSNHRFYKSYNSRSVMNGRDIGRDIGHDLGLNDNLDTFMGGPSSINLPANDLFPATSGFTKASRFNVVTPNMNMTVDPPFPMDMLYALPVNGCICYLQSRAEEEDNERLCETQRHEPPR